MNGKVLCIVQARLNSSRLPGKVIKKIGELRALDLLLFRLALAKKIDQVVLATTTNAEDDLLENIAQENKIACYRGNEHDVRSRYLDCIRQYQPDTVIRITGDCPFVEPLLIDQMIERYGNSPASYMNNTTPPTFPDGMDIEIFDPSVFIKVARNFNDPGYLEHVTKCLIDSEIVKKIYFT